MITVSAVDFYHPSISSHHLSLGFCYNTGRIGGDVFKVTDILDYREFGQIAQFGNAMEKIFHKFKHLEIKPYL